MLAKGFARIHRQNLINYGVLPLLFVHPEDYDRLRKGDVLHVRDLRRALETGKEIMLECGGSITARHGLTEKQVDTKIFDFLDIRTIRQGLGAGR